jgi:hypothetical protein
MALVSIGSFEPGRMTTVQNLLFPKSLKLILGIHSNPKDHKYLRLSRATLFNDGTMIANGFSTKIHV